VREALKKRPEPLNSGSHGNAWRSTPEEKKASAPHPREGLLRLARGRGLRRGSKKEGQWRAHLLERLEGRATRRSQKLPLLAGREREARLPATATGTPELKGGAS